MALSIGSALLGRVKADYAFASQELSVDDKTSVANVLELLGLDPETALLIVLNETMVARTAIHTKRLADGDKLSLMPPIHAG